MNADLLQNLYTGLETLMRTRHRLVLDKTMKTGRLPGVTFTLTPALSPGEREKCSPVGCQTGAPQRSPACSFGLTEAADEANNILNTESRESLFPLPKGEGKATVQQLKLAQKPESLPS